MRGVVSVAGEETGVDTMPSVLLVEAAYVAGTLVVEIGTETVLITVLDAGQLVTSGPQLMTVDTKVE